MRTYFILLIAFLFLNGISVEAFSQEQDSIDNKSSELSFGVDAGFGNKYMWRGICINNGLVFQPDAYISYGNFSLTAWSNITLWDINSENAHEVDFILTYSNSIFNFDFESSLIYYGVINSESPNTGELLVNLSYPLDNFNIFSNFAVDVFENAGAIYDELGVGYEKELSDKWTVSGSLLTGIASNKFNEYYLADDNHPEISKNAFNLVGANATLTYSPVNDFYIDAHYQFNHTLDKDLVPSLTANPNYFEIIFRKEF
jgi:hypothetical protein